MARRAAAALLWLLAGAAHGAETRALDARWVRDQWTDADGLPLNHINDVVVDPEGRVWLATYDGLVRFDGQRFETWRAGEPGGPQSDRLRYLAQHPGDGALWLFGDDHSLQRRQGAQRADFAGGPGPWSGPPVAAAGSLWAGLRGQLHRIDAAPRPIDTGVAVVSRVYLQPDGRLALVGDDTDTYLWDPRHPEAPATKVTSSTAIRRERADSPIAAGQSTAWLAARTGLGLEAVTAGLASAAEAEGQLWLATVGDGLLRLRPRALLAHRGPEGGRTNVRRLWWEAPTETLWAHTELGEWWPVRGAGAAPLSTPPVSRLDCPPGHDRPFTGPDGRRWLRSCNSLWRQTAEGWAQVPAPAPQTPGPVWELPGGERWLSGGDGLWRVTPTAGSGAGPGDGGADGAGLSGLTYAAVPGPAGPLSWVLGFAPLPGGGALIGDGDGLYVVEPGAAQARPLDAAARLGPIRHLWLEGERLWVATGTKGLCLAPMPGGAPPAAGAPLQARCLGPGSSIDRATLHAVLVDDQGRLWIASNQGLGLIGAAEAEAFASGAEAALPVLWLGVGDGLLDRELNGFVGEAALRTPDGHLWFASQDGVVEVDPASFGAPRPPAARFEGALVGAEAAALDGGLRLGPGHPPLKITWTAPASPWAEQLQFRTRLGPAGAWSAPGAERFTELEALPAGASALELQARLGGAWGPVARLPIERAPALHERGAFPYLMALGLAGLGLLGLGAWSAAQARARRRLEALVAAQTEELRARAARLEQVNGALAEANGALEGANLALGERVAELAERGEALRASNRQIAAQAAQLEELDRLKRQLIANLSHELRTPLSLIVGPLSALRAEVAPDSRAARQLELAGRNAERLHALIGQLFDLSRAQAGGLRLRARHIELGAFLRGLLSRFEPAAEGAGRRLTLEAPEGPLPLWIDPDLIEKALSNLLVNALRFTPPGGGVRVWVEAGPSAEGEAPEWAQISVEDEGPGVPEAQREAIFGRFVQVEGGLDRPHDGAGLGLALARELVELHGGQISADAGAVGARFALRLPAGVAHLGPADIELDDGARRPDDLSPGGPEVGAAAPPSAVSGDPRAERAAGGPGGRPRVLLVEDHAELRAFLAEHLAERFEVEAAPGGAEALALAAAAPFDLVISDVMMPGMDGHTLAQRLRALPGGAGRPLLFISARHAVEDRVAGLELADDYLPKPFQVPELMARAAALLRRARPPAAPEALPALHEGAAPVGPPPAAPPDPPEAAEDQRALDARAAALLQRLERAADPRLADPDFNVGELARVAGMSPRTLQAHLQQLGLPPPVEWLRVRRLDRAAALLRSGAAGGVAGVAEAVGMSRSYFSRAYAAHTGRPPTDDLQR